MTEAEAIQYYINSIYDVFEEGTAADTVAAIVVEPLQGEGGFIPAPIAWVRKLVVMYRRIGRPKEMLLTPKAQCRPNSS